MAVYTDVSAEDLGRFLAGYDLGELLSYKGIAEGVENSNFLVHTGTGHYILTLYEKRVAAGDVPFFLALMEHLAARGITCPQPVKARTGATLGTLCSRPAAIVTFLDGMWMRLLRLTCKPRLMKLSYGDFVGEPMPQKARGPDNRLSPRRVEASSSNGT